MMNLVRLHHQETCDPSSLSSVDTTLRLSTGPSFISLAKIHKEIISPSDFLGLGIDLSRNYQQSDEAKEEVPASSTTHENITALDPTPLRSYHPTFGFKDHYHVLEDDQGGGPSTTCTSSKKRKQKSMKLPGPHKKRARRTKANVDDETDPEPDIPSSELLQRIGTEIRPVFLYRKKLEKWDTVKDQNRLLVNRKAKLMGFLTEEERRAVEDCGENPGLDVIAMDSMGSEYHMRCKNWASVGKVVIKTSWHKAVVANGALVGYMVHLWGYRKDDGKFRLAVEFHYQRP